MQIQNIKKSYGKKEVLKDVSFSAKKGECIGILGANGSGKSTLFNVLSGVIKSGGGKFLYEGDDLFKNTKKRQDNVGYVPQGLALFDELSAKDNLRLWYKKADMEKELKSGVLKMLGIDTFLDVLVKNMSGGMKKRLSIGCAVSKNIEILLLDEPTGALDIVCKDNIFSYLQSFKSKGGIIVMATHDVFELSLCDKIYILKNGVLIETKVDNDVKRLAELL